MDEQDRSVYDPFAPAGSPVALLGVVTPPERQDDDSDDGGQDGLPHDRYLSKAELVDIADARGLSTDGTRAELMDRIRRADDTR